MRTHRVAMPAWVLAYRYRGKPYRAVIHGQDAELITADAPLDGVKVAIVVLGVIAAIALIALLAGRH